MSAGTEKPTLHFFTRDTPRELMSRPPLCSSLQSLESSFLLIAMQRYPHALVACASAVESALKAGLNKGENGPGLHSLINEAKQCSPGLLALCGTGLDEFRHSRNRFVHYGFSPRDDDQAAKLLLNIGFKFLEQCYKEFFTCDSNAGLCYDFKAGLYYEVFEQLEVAIESHNMAGNLQDLHHTSYFCVFGHLIRFLFRGSFLAPWEIAAVQEAEESCANDDECREQKSKLMSSLRTSETWDFDCPVCGGYQMLVCEIDDEQLGPLGGPFKSLGFLRAGCANCGLIIPSGCRFLTDTLCREQIARDRPAILKSLGIVENGGGE